MNNNFTPEMIEKAKACASAEELITLAAENGIKMTAEEASKHFAGLHPKTGELRDDELENVAGGCGGDDDKMHCADCGRVIEKSEVAHLMSDNSLKCNECYDKMVQQMIKDGIIAG